MIGFEIFSSSELFEEQKKEPNRSTVALPDSFIVADIETTGFLVGYCEIIEIAAVKVQNGQIIDTFETLVKPEEEIPLDIQKLTGITDECVKDAPSCDEVIKPFLDFVSDYYLIGHRFSFDMSFLKYAAEHVQRKLDNQFVDTYRLFRKLHPELPHHRLKDMTAFYQVENKSSHRALSDALATLHCYNKLREDVLLKYSCYESFIKEFPKGYSKRQKKHTSKKVDARDIQPETLTFDETHPVFEKEFVFTGTLTGMTRAEAMQRVVNLGGKVANSITKKTNYLIVGAADIQKIQENGPTSKMQKCQLLRSKGLDIFEMSEATFFDMIAD